MIDILDLPDKKGIYLIILYLAKDVEIDIGKLGRQHFSTGWWFYIGSAYGPGGLRARLKHHIACEHKRLHWHMDYFRPQAQLRQILLFDKPRDFEHQVADYFRAHLKLSYPVAGFGASDCDCPSHLFYTPDKIDLDEDVFFQQAQLISLGDEQ